MSPSTSWMKRRRSSGDTPRSSLPRISSSVLRTLASSSAGDNWEEMGASSDRMRWWTVRFDACHLSLTAGASRLRCQAGAPPGETGSASLAGSALASFSDSFIYASARLAPEGEEPAAPLRRGGVRPASTIATPAPLDAVPRCLGIDDPLALDDGHPSLHAGDQLLADLSPRGGHEDRLALVDRPGHLPGVGQDGDDLVVQRLIRLRDPNAHVRLYLVEDHGDAVSRDVQAVERLEKDPHVADARQVEGRHADQRRRLVEGREDDLRQLGRRVEDEVTEVAPQRRDHLCHIRGPDPVGLDGVAGRGQDPETARVPDEVHLA